MSSSDHFTNATDWIKRAIDTAEKADVGDIARV
jgi:hypothetical protein